MLGPAFVLTFATPVAAAEPAELMAHSALRVVVERDDHSQKEGAGVLIERRGKWLVTSYRVVADGRPIQDGADNVRVYFPFVDNRSAGERRYFNKYDLPVSGRILAVDARRDLALIELDRLPPEAIALPMAFDDCKLGDAVFLPSYGGNRRSSKWAATGTVRGLADARIAPERETWSASIVLKTAAEKPYPSGGPVINASGELVGIVASRNAKTDQHAVHCIAISEIKDLVKLARAYPRERCLLDPRTASDYQRRALYYQQKSRLENALADLRQAQRLGPESTPDSVILRAVFRPAGR
jgi:S1-C subfamily serine protease